MAERFSSRWGLMLAMLGMAVGTGNIWRFPRIAAAYGGGEFLVAWICFLLLWSVPLILVEFSLGKRLRSGTVGTFHKILGANWTWLGAWIAWVAAAIGFYYAVVMGWTIRYFLAAIRGELVGTTEVTAADGSTSTISNAENLWDTFSFTPQVEIFHFLAMGMAVFVVWNGVKGIERAARILMPCLFVLIFVLLIRALTLPNAGAGLDFLFSPDWAALANHEVWLAALTQNAWDTGAGWGLVLSYAIYSRAKEDTNLNSFLVAFGNNSISLVAGILVLVTVFSVRPDAAQSIVGAGQTNEGLTFIWIPQLFERIPGGAFFMILFFLALVFAAWTSLVATFELVSRALREVGISRRAAIVGIAIVSYIAGVPSALSQSVFDNQDFVWSVALMFCGLSFAVLVYKIGVVRFRKEFINTDDQDFKVGVWWEWAIRLVAVEALILVVWTCWGQRDAPLFGALGLGNMALQWILAAAVFIGLNSWFVKRLTAQQSQAAE